MVVVVVVVVDGFCCVLCPHSYYSCFGVFVFAICPSRFRPLLGFGVLGSLRVVPLDHSSLAFPVDTAAGGRASSLLFCSALPDCPPVASSALNVFTRIPWYAFPDGRVKAKKKTDQSERSSRL